MKTNGFGLFRGPDRQDAASQAAKKVARYCDALVVCQGSDILDTATAEDAELVIWAMDDGRGLPLVHGFRDADGKGEFAMVAQTDGTIEASRDRLGTRPLYVDERMSCIGTDHRMFRGTRTLVPAGTSIRIGRTELDVSPRFSATEGRWSSLDECATELSDLLKKATRRRVSGRKKVAVSFSGGLDSSLIARLASDETEVVLCSVYASGSRDQHQAKSAADKLGLDYVGIEMDKEAALRELREMDLPFEPTPMDRALWCVYSASSRQARAEGAELILLGQLADEQFGGYMKYTRAAEQDGEIAAMEMMWADVVASSERAFVRDEEACARFGEARFPFADEDIASFALSVPVKYKISDGERKVVLRKAAELLGLPGSLVSEPKKAAQYSSGVAKLIA
jgi:asparagine synthase (glutamine-hydrolysing)